MKREAFSVRWVVNVWRFEEIMFDWVWREGLWFCQLIEKWSEERRQERSTMRVKGRFGLDC